MAVGAHPRTSPFIPSSAMETWKQIVKIIDTNLFLN